jgi:N-dimethylarginine dimethylaminohydrolase
LDGGNVCDVDNRFLIGISARTKEEGARQLAATLGSHGYNSAILDVRGVPGLLHLKSWLAALVKLRYDVVTLGMSEFYALGGAFVRAVTRLNRRGPPRP